MINILTILIILYIFYNTIRYAKVVWDNEKKYAAIAVGLLALSNIAIPVYLRYKDFFMKFINL